MPRMTAAPKIPANTIVRKAQISAEILFSLPICVIKGLRKATPVGRGGGEADGEGGAVRKEPSHPLSRELSQRESLWTRSCNLRGMVIAQCICNTNAKQAIKRCPNGGNVNEKDNINHFFALVCFISYGLRQ